MTMWTDPERVPAGSIVVGWDGSPHATSALAWAAQRATAERRPVTVTHAVAPNLAGDLAVWRDDELRRVGAGLVGQAREYLDEHAPQVDVHLLVTLHDARTALVEMSRRASMVVVGSHGRGPVTSKLLGSVGIGVVLHASCPVVVVRAHRPGTVRRGVLAAVDVDDPGAGVLGFAFHEASVLTLPLTVVHTVPEDSSTVMLSNAERQLSELLAGSRESYPDVHCTTAVIAGSTESVILDQARNRHLAVIGAPRQPHRVLSTTTSRLIERADAPVAVVPLDVSAAGTARAQHASNR